jgi:hypothetical protein
LNSSHLKTPKGTKHYGVFKNPISDSDDDDSEDDDLEDYNSSDGDSNDGDLKGDDSNDEKKMGDEMEDGHENEIGKGGSMEKNAQGNLKDDATY